MLVHRTHFEQVSLVSLKKILAKKTISAQEITEQTRRDQERVQEGDDPDEERAGGEN
jgi:hypothetical protein